MASRFEKFSERARRVMSLAQEETQRFNHNYIGTEHILLGLVRETDGVGARALSSLSVELSKIRSTVEFIIGRGERPSPGDIGLTPRAKKVIELAVDEARRLSHDFIGTEHLLIGIMREGEGVAAGVLESLGVSLDKVRLAVVALHNELRERERERERERQLYGELRYKVAVACRILGMLGLVNESTGHVSARIPGTDEMFIRCRGGEEEGIAFTGVHHIRRTDFDGEGAHVGMEHASPNETPIHGEIYRARPEAGAVVHAHPWYALLCGVTGIEYKPVFAGYDPQSLSIAVKGVPVYPRAATVTDKEQAAEMLACMGERDVVLMRGHGISVYAPTVEQATALAIRFDRLSRVMWEIALSGREPVLLSDADMGRYGPGAPRRRGGWSERISGSENFAWNHYMRLLRVSGYGLPEDVDAP